MSEPRLIQTNIFGFDYLLRKSWKMKGLVKEDAKFNLRITNLSEPLESPSIRTIFDQFERQNNQIFVNIRSIRRTLFKACVVWYIWCRTTIISFRYIGTSNFVLGSAWKSDATVQQSHPAYFMWHSLTDHRLQIELQRFRHDEASAAITLFEKELGETLLANLNANY